MDEWAQLLRILVKMGFDLHDAPDCPPEFASAAKKHPPGEHNLIHWTLRRCPRVVEQLWAARPKNPDPDSRLWKTWVGFEAAVTASETSRRKSTSLQFCILHPAAAQKYAYIKVALHRKTDHFRSAAPVAHVAWDGFPDDWFRLPLLEMLKLKVNGLSIDLARTRMPGTAHGKLQLFRDRLLRAQLHQKMRRVYLPDPSKLLFLRANDLDRSAWGDRQRTPVCVDDLMLARLRARFGLRLSEAVRVGRENDAWIDRRSAVYIMFVYDPIDPLCSGGVYVGKTKENPADRVLRHLSQTHHLIDVALHAVPPTFHCLPCVVTVVLETDIDEKVLAIREEIYTRLFCGFGPGGFNMMAASKIDDD